MTTNYGKKPPSHLHKRGEEQAEFVFSNSMFNNTIFTLV